MTNNTDGLLALIREGKPMSIRQQLILTVRLSIPSVLAQLSYMVMQYIDAAMVGRLGVDAAASIGLVSTSTWLFWGVCSSCASGFSVQVAHLIGAKEYDRARDVVRQSFVAVLMFSAVLAMIGMVLSGYLPGWLGGADAIRSDSSAYFFLFAMFLPTLQVYYLSSGVLRCSGNIKFPSMVNIWMCVLDVVFNFFLIFPSREWVIGDVVILLPGFGMGVKGAALGTALAETFGAVILTWYLFRRSKELALKGTHGSFRLKRRVSHKAIRIGLPMGLEHIVICGAQILTTVIVAPLGVFAIAANSFAITAESLCYMPGYGIAEAATTLIGQSYGACRRELARSFARITVGSGMVVMGALGVVMYICAPYIIGLMTPDAEIISLGAMALRIEAFAEPMFAAAIIGYGVFVGAGDTIIPSLMNFGSIWAVRLTLAALLAPSMGLKGVWVAMCLELCFRGAIFLCRLKWGRWMKEKKDK